MSWETPAQTVLRQRQSSRSQEQHRKLPRPQSSQKSIHTCPAHLEPQGFVTGPQVPICNPHAPLLCHTKIHNSALVSGVRRWSRNGASALQDTLMSWHSQSQLRSGPHREFKILPRPSTRSYAGQPGQLLHSGRIKDECLRLTSVIGCLTTLYIYLYTWRLLFMRGCSSQSGWPSSKQSPRHVAHWLPTCCLDSVPTLSWPPALPHPLECWRGTGVILCFLQKVEWAQTVSKLIGSSSHRGDVRLTIVAVNGMLSIKDDAIAETQITRMRAATRRWSSGTICKEQVRAV